MRWLYGITDPMDMDLSKLKEIVEEIEKTSVLQSMESERIRHELAAEHHLERA